MKNFTFIKGPFAETITLEVNEDSMAFQTKFITELKSKKFRNSDVDIFLEEVEDESIIKLSNKEKNIFIRNPIEKKSAYMTIDVVSSGQQKTKLEIRIRPNSTFAILFFSNVIIGIGLLFAMLISRNIFHGTAPGGTLLLLGGLAMAVFGRNSKKNLYNSLIAVLNRIK